MKMNFTIIFGKKNYYLSKNCFSAKYKNIIHLILWNQLDPRLFANFLFLKKTRSLRKIVRFSQKKKLHLFCGFLLSFVTTLFNSNFLLLHKVYSRSQTEVQALCHQGPKLIYAIVKKTFFRHYTVMNSEAHNSSSSERKTNFFSLYKMATFSNYGGKIMN